MKKNLGTIDRSIRIIAAAVIAILLLTGGIAGTIGTLLGIVAGVLLLTSAISFCPLYALVKISTRKEESAK